MPDRRLALVDSVRDAPDAGPDLAAVLVLDTAWTPPMGGRPDLIPVRPLVGEVLRREDLFIGSYERLEAWADATELPARLTAAGVSWWYRRRFGYWLRLHELLLWRAVLDACLDRVGPVASVELHADVPALAQVVPLVARRAGLIARLPLASAAGDGDDDGSAPQGLLGRVLTAPGRRARRHELARRAAVLARRVDGLADGASPFLFLTNPLVHQVVRTASGERRVDPFLGSVAERLAADGVGSVVMDLGGDPRDDESWASLDADPARLPASLLATRWEAPADRAASAAEAAGVAAAIDAAPTVPLDDGGVDFGPLFRSDLRRFARVGLPARLRETARVARMLRELRPRGLVLVNEYGRLEWLAGAHAAGVPVFAVQHGIIYPWHLGYRHPRVDGLPFADRTFVFGDYERRVLLESGGYRPDEVVVSGAPRLDLARLAGSGDRTAERAAVREELGIAVDDRMLVISTTHERLHRRFYWMHALASLLDVELPRVHLVFKQHPAELDEGPYRALVEGLASAAGRVAPPVSVVRDIDLYRLLRAADAHLGLYSTVLTDAVATGTPNLVALAQAHRDLLGYVAAGVARGVRDGAELLAALDRPVVPDEALRRAFLDDHFRPGDASDRIRDVLLHSGSGQADRGAGADPAPGRDAAADRSPAASGSSR